MKRILLFAALALAAAQGSSPSELTDREKVRLWGLQADAQKAWGDLQAAQKRFESEQSAMMGEMTKMAAQHGAVGCQLDMAMKWVNCPAKWPGMKRGK